MTILIHQITGKTQSLITIIAQFTPNSHLHPLSPSGAETCNFPNFHF